MMQKLLSLMACPECQSDLDLHVFTSDQKHVVVDGYLICRGCHMEYMVVDGIPRMLPLELYSNDAFLEKYREKIATICEQKRIARTVRDALCQHKKNTRNSFGHEWKKFARFGWDDPEWGVEKEKKRFYENTFFTDDELKGKLTLDGGCGNGRYARQALEQEAEVVCIDLSQAVDVAQKNINENAHVHFVQGDLFKLPFKPGAFDVAYSIGVLMHTGNTEKAFKSLSSKVKRGGLVGISVYQKQNPLHEINDWWIREVTIRLPDSVLYYLTLVMSRFARMAWKVRLLGVINAFFRLEPFHLCVYDWYKAPVAHHHTLPEVKKWFDQIGATEIRDAETEQVDTRDAIRKWIWPRCGFTVRGKLLPQ